MQRAKITGVRQATVVEVPAPKPKADWVLVKVLSAPMCTEFKGFVSGDGCHGYGHEAAGVVAEVAQPCRVKPGDRVVVQPGTPCGTCPLCVAGDYIHCEHWFPFAETTGSPEGLATMAQYLLKQDWLLSPVPDDVSDDLASLAVCGLGPTFEAFDATAVDAFDTVLITGLGPVGLGGVVNARFRGARVIGVESNPTRARLALELGAEKVVDPRDPDALHLVREAAGAGGIGMAVDCAGIVSAHRLCMDAVRRKGRVAFVGQCHEPTPLTISKDMIQRGLRLYGIWHYNLASFPRVLDVIRRSPVIAKMITHVLPLSQVQRAWELQVSGECGKIILKPWG